MDQPSFFHEPPVELPSRGKTAQSLEASRSGARLASALKQHKTDRILEAMARYGVPISRQTISAQTGIPINAICSIVHGLLKRGVIEAAGTERGNFGSGTTTRETFRIRRTQ